MRSALGARALRDAERDELAARLARDADTGANTIADMLARDELNAARRGWRETPCETTGAEVLNTPQRIADAPDMRAVSIGRVYSIDLPAALRRYCAKRGKDERETLRTEALLLIARWSEQGTGARRVSLGVSDPSASDPGCMPSRAVWLERDARGRLVLTDGAWRVMHAAILQAERAREMRQLDAVAHAETPTEGVALGRIAESESAHLAPDPGTLPDADAPEVLAEVLGVSLNAARALVFRAYAPRVGGGGSYGAEQDAQDWSVSVATLRKALSVGAAELVSTYPDPAQLLDALRVAAPRYREALAQRATLALLDWRDEVADGMPESVLTRTRARAEQATRDYRSAVRSAPEHEHALELAALGAVRRATGSHAPERAERLAQCVARLIDAESKRERARVATMAQGGAPARTPNVPMARTPEHAERYAQLSSRLADADGSAWLGLGARTPRARKALATLRHARAETNVSRTLTRQERETDARRERAQWRESYRAQLRARALRRAAVLAVVARMSTQGAR